jgi:hypothetical protein
MALKDFSFPTKKIETSNGNFTVRGLNTNDLILLFSQFQQEIASISAASADKEILADEIGKRLLLDAPRLGAAIICRAADEPDQIESVVQLPFGVAFSALEAIFALTFESEGGAANFLAKLQRLAGQLPKLSSSG